MVIIKILLLICLCAIFFQDYKERMVYGILFLLVSVGFALLHIQNTGIFTFFINGAINLSLVIGMLGILFLYARFRFSKLAFTSVFAWGDILMLVILSLSFAPIAFITFFVFGLLFSLLLHSIMTSRFIDTSRSTLSRKPTILNAHQKNSVPLAGYLSLFFALVFITHWLGWYQQLYIL